MPLCLCRILTLFLSLHYCLPPTLFCVLLPIIRDYSLQAKSDKTVFVFLVISYKFHYLSLSRALKYTRSDIQSLYVYHLLQLQDRKSVALKTVLVKFYCVGLFFPEKPSAHVRGVNFLSALHHAVWTHHQPPSLFYTVTHTLASNFYWHPFKRID